MDPFKPLTVQEQDELEAFLLSELSSEHTMSLVALDGLLTCIVSGPDTIVPSEWLPLVMDMEQDKRLKNFDHAERIFDLMTRHLNSIAFTLMNNPQEFEPMLYEGPYERALDSGGEEWCMGYIAGISLRENRWAPLAEGRKGAMLLPILTLGLEEGQQSIARAADPDAVYLQWVELLASSAQSIHAFWLKRRSKEMKRPSFTVEMPIPFPEQGDKGSAQQPFKKPKRTDIN